MSRLAIASWTLSSVTAIAVVVGVGVVPALGRHAEHVPPRPKLVESPDCDRRTERSHAAHTPSSGTSGGTTQAVTVSVPRTTILRLDAAGRVIAALTNTGCAPRARDDVYVTVGDGTFVRSTSFDVTRIAWTGNFRSPGVFQPQR